MIRVFILLLFLPILSFSQWQPGGTTTGDIYYNNGNVGIGTSIPLESLQIGDRWTFHSGGYKVIGYNFYFDSGDKRIVDKESSNITLTGTGDILLRTAAYGNAGSTIHWFNNLVLKNNGYTGFGTANPAFDIDIIRPFVSNSESTLFLGQDHNFGAATGRYGIGLSLLHADATSSGKTGFLNIWSGGARNRVMSFTYTGNVGIGTATPSSPLDIKKVVKNGDLMVLGLDDVHPKRISMGTSAWSGVIGLFDAGSLQKVRISAGNGYTYFNGTNVLIGKTSQTNTSYKLDVAGKVRANEIVVNTTGADYVFENDYKLKTLEEVEKFIDEYGHLPGIPTAEEMQTNGMEMGELNTKLLEKIEELTLYMLDFKAEMQELKKENHYLKQQILGYK